MVRYHYGPWDQRYYQMLAYLEAKGIIDVNRVGQRYDLTLTKSGRGIAERLLGDLAFAELVEHTRNVGNILANKKGNYLKKIIYDIFKEQVADKQIGEVIE